jgi:hypothetical protein
MKKHPDYLLFIIFALLLIIIRIPSLEEPLDNDSGANAFFARQLTRGEVLYDKFHPVHHMPGIYYTYEIAFELFGDTPIAPKIFLYFWALVCTWLIFQMGRLFFNRLSGILGAIFFILVSSQILMKGTTVETEHFANLPLTAGAFLALILIYNKAPAWQFLWVGFIGAICMLYKPIYVAPFAMAGFGILIAAWLERSQTNAVKTAILRLVWMSIGLFVPLIAVGAYFASLGLWDRFFLVLETGSRYITGSGYFPWLPRPFSFPILWMGISNAALLMFGLIGTYRCARRAFPVRKAENLTHFMLVLWLIISFAEAGIRFGGWPQYALLVVPPLSLMAAYEITMACERWKLKMPKKQAAAGMSMMIALVVLNFSVPGYAYYGNYILYKMDRITYEDFIYGYTGISTDMAFTGAIALDAKLVGDYLQAHTTSEDLIYLWTESVQAYYYADRKPPVDVLWPDFVHVTGPISAERILGPRTKYVVLNNPKKMGRPGWLASGVQHYYYLETIIGEHEIYRRREK